MYIRKLLFTSVSSVNIAQLFSYIFLKIMEILRKQSCTKYLFYNKMLQYYILCTYSCNKNLVYLVFKNLRNEEYEIS